MSRASRRRNSGTDAHRRAWWEHPALQFVAVAAILMLVYRPALNGAFVFDDQAFIVNNRLVQAPDGWWRIWLSPRESADYWPLSYSVFWAEWQIWGIHTFGYHALNVLLHALNAVLLARMLAALGVPGASLVALVFALHPVNVEAVAWIFQLKTTLSFALGQASFLMYLDHEQRRARGPYFASLGLFALALLAKTVVAPLPAALLGLHAWRGESRSRRVALEVLPFFALAGTAILVGVWFQAHGARPEEFDSNLTWPQRVALSGQTFWFYLGKILFPIRLLFIYPQHPLDVSRLGAFVPFAAMLGFLGVAWALRGRPWGKPLLAATTWYAVMISPVMGFLDISYMRYSYVADHWAYVAMPGVLAFVVGGAFHLVRSKGRRFVSAGAIAAAAVLLVLGISTWRQASLYASPETIWSDTVRRNPSAWVARFNLGVEYQARGDVRSAVDQYVVATALKPDYARAEYNLGVGLRDLGRPEEALVRFRRAISIRPAYPRALKELGATLRVVDRREEALAPLTDAVRLQPVYPDAHAQRGGVLLELGRESEAQAELQRALEQDPSLAATWLTRRPPWMSGGPEDEVDRWRILAAALGEAGRFPEALEAAGRAQAIAGARGDRMRLDRLDRMAMSFRHRRPYREAATP